MRRAVARFLSATRPLFTSPASHASPAACSAALLDTPPHEAMRCPAGPAPRAPGVGAACAPSPPPGARLAAVAAPREGRPALVASPPPGRPFTPALASRSPAASSSSSSSSSAGPAPPAARRASSSSDGGRDPAGASSPDLRRVPGVGLKNELLLRGAGIHCLADLAAAYHAEQAGGGVAARMVEYLQVRGRGGVPPALEGGELGGRRAARGRGRGARAGARARENGGERSSCRTSFEKRARARTRAPHPSR